MLGSKESDVAMEQDKRRGERKVRERREEVWGGQEGAEREMTGRRRWKAEEGGEKDEIKDEEERKGGGEGRTGGKG